MITQLKKEFSNPHVHLAALLNFSRDAVWTATSYLLLNKALETTEDSGFDSDSQWFGQQLFASLTMFGTLLSIWGFYACKKPKEDDGSDKKFLWDHGMIYWAAAAVAIYCWDKAQIYGIQFFKNRGYSDESAGYLASLATGTEGCVQFSAITLLRTLFLAEYRDFALENPGMFIKLLLPRLLCSLTLVASPGASWQLVYNAGVIHQWGALLTTLAVASTVAFFNYASVKASIALLTCFTSEKEIMEVDITPINVNHTTIQSYGTETALLTQSTGLQLTAIEEIPMVEEKDDERNNTDSPTTPKATHTNKSSFLARKGSLSKPEVDYFLPRSSHSLNKLKGSEPRLSSKWSAVRKAVATGQLATEMVDHSVVTSPA
jgi:hypothetical protein